MSVRSNGVIKVRRTATSTSRGDFVGLRLALEYLLATGLDRFAAMQQTAQRFGAGDNDFCVLFEERGKTALRCGMRPETSRASVATLHSFFAGSHCRPEAAS